MRRFSVKSIKKLKMIFAESSNKKFHIIKLMLIGTFMVTAVLLCLLFVSVFVFHRTYILSRLIIGGSILAYLVCAALMLRQKFYKIVAWMLLSLYGLIGSIVLLIWGINVPLGLLVLAFVIFLSSVMLGSRHIPIVAIGCIALLFLIHLIASLRIVEPDLISGATISGFGDVISYSTIFGVFALVAWISSDQTEKALNRARIAESGLQKERDLLSIRLDERTRLLRQAQLDEMRQLYNFAELGQLTTVILHELANHLSILTLDIDDLKYSKKHAETIQRAKESIGSIDEIVKKVRNQLKGNSSPVQFDAIKVLEETIDLLSKKAIKSRCKVDFENATKLTFNTFGDPMRLSQVLTILINNAIDINLKHDRSEITVTFRVEEDTMEIIVIDYCGAISKNVMRSLFAPLRSTKRHGLGIGLFIAREVIETHFKGTISAASGVNRTEFKINLPAYKTSSIKP